MKKLIIFIVSVTFLCDTASASVIKRKSSHVKYEHELGNFTSAAVAIDGKPCAEIGK